MNARISSHHVFNQGSKELMNQQTSLDHTHKQLSTGKQRVNPSDDPAGSAWSLSLKQTLQITDQFQDNGKIAQNRLDLEDSTLQGVINVLQRARELAVQGANDTYNADDRAIISTEVRQLIQEVLGLANTQDSNGSFLFSGFQGNVKPFTQNGDGEFQYHGDQGQRLVQIGPERQVASSDSGHEVFMRIASATDFRVNAELGNTGGGEILSGKITDPEEYQPDHFSVIFSSPNTFDVVNNMNGHTALENQTYTSGEAIKFNGMEITIQDVGAAPVAGDQFTVRATNQSLFATLEDFSLAMDANDPSMANSLADIDRVLDNITETVTRVGARMNSVENEREVNDSYKFQIQTTLSDVDDVDYLEAITRLNEQMMGLKAAQQAFVKVSGLSLFNYLN
jgi:flagellar hook-associated protein 3 FlgL